MAPSPMDSLTQHLPLDIVGEEIESTTPSFGLTQSHDDTHEQNLVENMARFRKNPFGWLREIALYVSGTGWRAYEDVVGQPVFYSGYTENIKSAVLASPKLQQKLAELTERRLQVEEKDLLLDTASPTYTLDMSERRAEIASSLM